MSGIDAGTPRRIGAVLLRHWYLIASSWPRFVDLCYWPIVQMILWGFIQTFLMRQSSFFAQAGGILLGAVMLWDVLFRGQIGLAIAFFEEVYSRNLGHLFATPLRIGEYIAALTLVSLARTVIGLFPATVLAIWFFGFSLYSLGIALIAFFVSLIVAALWIGRGELRLGVHFRARAPVRRLLSHHDTAPLGAGPERSSTGVLYLQRHARCPDRPCRAGRLSARGGGIERRLVGSRRCLLFDLPCPGARARHVAAIGGMTDKTP